MKVKAQSQQNSDFLLPPAPPVPSTKGARTIGMSRTGKKHKTWNPDQMKLAIRGVREKEMGYLKASKVFDVPKSSLEDYVKQFDKTPEQLVAAPIGRRPVLSLEMEEDLVSYCLGSLNVTQFLLLENRRASQKLESKALLQKILINFLTFWNQQWKKLIIIPEKINYNPSRLYNVDESGITTVQSKNSRVITLKGKKQVGTVTAAERGALVTVVFCMNAVGGFVPPLFVFPRKNMKAELLD
ncbi:CENP-B N-terminal DNA-binding domain [Popillia japonica]|uniref:CENP-B N-terminal DNA-binding domain n=1 Tax=Popillia japonica TaxID=7064 RepID=A0AAW1LW16_POPJA